MNQKTAIVFPGQGSQAVGMLADLAESFAVVKNVFASASEVLNYDLWQLIQEGPAEQLNQTRVAQPALLAASYGVWCVSEASKRDDVAVLAGHSLGEYSALVCAGVLSFEEAIKLVELRGELMQAAVPAGSGAMYAIIGLDDEAIIQCCASAEEGEVVSPVNFNSPGQVVIAGDKAAVERAAALCKEAGAKKLIPLAVSVPSHCALMKPAADALAAKLDSVHFKNPELPVINNVDVARYEDAESIKSALVRQLYSPVRWSETIKAMGNEGVSRIIECGPGKVLTGLNKRIDKTIAALAVGNLKSMNDFLAQ